LVIAAAALLTLAAVDLVVRRVAPPRNLREVQDAVKELEDGNPTALAIGSSHARTFAVLADSLATRSAGRERLLAVPVEWGKLSSYQWTLENRLLPLFDERDGDGDLRRGSLRRAIIVTEWWDSCAGADQPQNLPARAWAWQHYWDDLRRHGFSDYNSSFLSYRFSRLTRFSALMQDRGRTRFPTALREALVPGPAREETSGYRDLMENWQLLVETGDKCIGDQAQMASLVAMVDTLLARRLEVTVLLYPRMPSTLTPTARQTTLPRFVGMAQAALGGRNVRLIDLTDAAPLNDADFGEDFDHLLPEANSRFAGWALDGPFAFLLEGSR
jgi:hypothetical protein